MSVMALLSGLAVLGCGGSPAAAPTSSTTSRATSATFAGTPLEWISTTARPWNGRLNNDQDVIVSASKASSEEPESSFFGQLKTACRRMLDDATRAQAVTAAPSAPLDQAWKAMTADTAAYAEACLSLAQSRANSDFTRLQGSLQSMNAANASLNTVVNAIRGGNAGSQASG
jgi:hypothetical protein